MDRAGVVDEVLVLLPVLARGLGRPEPEELGELTEQGLPVDARVSPGHVQVLVALDRGPCSIGRLAEVVGVSAPAVTQLVNRLEEMGMVVRRHDETDRRVVLVDYVPEMRDIARRMMESRRQKLEEALGRMTDEEIRAFLKGLKSLIESFNAEVHS